VRVADEIAELEAERDQLAARVSEMREALKSIYSERPLTFDSAIQITTHHEGGGDGTCGPNSTAKFVRAITAIPNLLSASLASSLARMKAKHFREIVDGFEWPYGSAGVIKREIEERIAKLEKEAEGK
jgi:uncharacterized coiled-coil DUF342 family protein